MRNPIYVLFLAALTLAACHRNPDPKIDDVTVTETVQLDGLTAPVDIVRDEWGRAHVYASNEADLWLASGYVQASDRLLQMDLMRRFGSGTVAELVGALQPEQVDADFDMRVLGLRYTAEAIWAETDPGSGPGQALTQFAAGVNAYIDRVRTGDAAAPIEYGLLQYPVEDMPAWTEVDSLTVGRLLALDQSFYADFKSQVFDQVITSQDVFAGTERQRMHCDVLFRAQPAVDGTLTDPDAQRTNFSACPVDAVVATAVPSRKQTGAFSAFARRTLRHPLNMLWSPGAGSNGWVVSGAHTETGRPMLANDPHLPLTTPGIWYPVHLNTTLRGGTIELAGMQLPGLPHLLLGHNGQVAWGVTNVIPDVTDNYVETYSVGTGTNGVDQVFYNGEYVDLVERVETLETRVSRNEVSIEERTVYVVPHRSTTIVPNSYDAQTQTALSWRWTGDQPTQEHASFYDMMFATNVPEILALRARPIVPPSNLFFITHEGDIGWDASALYPLRDDDDGDPHTDPVMGPLPGTGSHEWIGFLDTSDVLQSVNPERGWMVTTNQDVLGQTLDNDPLNDPVYVSPVFAIGFRGARISELLERSINSGKPISARDFGEIQADVSSPLGTRMTPFLVDALEGQSGYEEIVTMLTDWQTRECPARSGFEEGVASAPEDAAATAFFNVWLSFFTDDVLADELDAIGYPDDAPNSKQFLSRGLLLILERPTDSATYVEALGDSILFDDLGTPAVTETRQQIIRKAADQTRAWLASVDGFDAEPASWRWGAIHTLRMEHLLGAGSLAVPSTGDPAYPNGFPRHGDNFTVDPAVWGVHGQESFGYVEGASTRVTIAAQPKGFRMWAGYPGGVSGDPTSEYYDALADTYVRNVQPELWTAEKDVAAKATSRLVMEAK